MNKDKQKIISQIEAAAIAGVTKQAIAKLKNTRSFFTKQNKINANHPDWKSYLNEHKAKEKPKYKNNVEDFQWLNEKPTTIQEEKIYADILQKKIDIMKELDIVIEKKIVISAFGEIVKSIQLNLIDYEKRVAPLIAAKLGLPGTEKTIEKIMGPEKKKSMENVIHAVNKAIDKL